MSRPTCPNQQRTSCQEEPRVGRSPATHYWPPGPIANRLAADMPLLEVRDLSVRFGGVVALDSVSFSVDQGQVVALIGPNGAGKTTLFNVITRVYRPNAGSVLVDGQAIQHIPAHRVISLGLARTFQNVALFRSMTVVDNVLVGDN